MIETPGTYAMVTVAEGTPMEIPNLLELVEAFAANAGILADLSVCGGKASDDINGLPSDLVDLSLCTDEGGDAGASDVRLKTDIEQVGTTVYGLPLYHFRYKTGTERFEGVMAQDVLEVMPDAVIVGRDGYYRVKYGQLGIKMTRA
jgi:hypothetical protein